MEKIIRALSLLEGLAKLKIEYQMEKEKSIIIVLLFWFAIAGNILFVLWILYNGINEGFQGTTIEKISYVTLIGLLTVNAFLLIHYRGRQNKNDYQL